MKTEIAYHSVRLCELEEYVFSKTFYEWENIPISHKRAKYYIHNPRAEKQDLVLITASIQGKIIAYRTLLPDWLFENNETIRFAWLSGNWVHPDFRRKGLSTRLLNKALEYWDNKLMYSNYAPNSKALYDKTGKFNRLAIINGFRLYHRFSLAELLYPKHAFFRSSNSFIRFCDNSLNRLFDLRFSGAKQKPTDSIFKEVEIIDSELNELIRKHTENNPFKRAVNEFETIFNYPWVTEANQAGDLDKKYHFSSRSKQFLYKKIILYTIDNQAEAFFIIKIRDSVLKVPYLFCEEKHKKKIARIIRYYIEKYKINNSVIFDEQLVKYIIIEKVPLLFKKSTYKDYFATKDLYNIIRKTNIKLYDGDGDGIFT